MLTVKILVTGSQRKCNPVSISKLMEITPPNAKLSYSGSCYAFYVGIYLLKAVYETINDCIFATCVNSHAHAVQVLGRCGKEARLMRENPWK